MSDVFPKRVCDQSPPLFVLEIDNVYNTSNSEPLDVPFLGGPFDFVLYRLYCCSVGQSDPANRRAAPLVRSREADPFSISREMTGVDRRRGI